MNEQNWNNADIKFYLSAGEAWEAMYQDCLNAQESIELEQYILNNDEIGKRFVKLFVQKAKQSIPVRLILDKVGSSSMVSSPEIKELQDHGGEVFFYNPITWLHIFLPHTWYPRNHIKTMLIDSKIAYTGGVCFAAFMANWRDTQARFTGALAKQAKEDFERLLEQLRERKKLRRFIRNRRKGSWLRYVVSRPQLGANPIYKEILGQIYKAEKKVCMVSPYFMPPFRLRRALRLAVRRGVKVQIMMSEKTDVALADCVSYSYFPQMLRAGVEILLYKKSVLHAKYTVVDGTWATIGSTNIDYLSLMRNREANLIIDQIPVAAELQSHFDRDVPDCIEVTNSFYESLPPHIKLAGFLGRFFRKIL